MHLQFLLWYSKMSGVSNTTRSHLHTCIASLVLWPSLHAWTPWQRYHMNMNRYETTMASYFDLFTPHQHGIADTCWGGFLQTSFSDSYILQMWYSSMSGNSTAVLSFLPAWTSRARLKLLEKSIRHFFYYLTLSNPGMKRLCLAKTLYTSFSASMFTDSTSITSSCATHWFTGKVCPWTVKALVCLQTNPAWQRLSYVIICGQGKLKFWPTKGTIC